MKTFASVLYLNFNCFKFQRIAMLKTISDNLEKLSLSLNRKSSTDKGNSSDEVNRCLLEYSIAKVTPHFYVKVIICAQLSFNVFGN